MNIQSLKASISPITGNFDCQVVGRRDDETSTNKPFIELELADVTGTEKVKFWSDSAAFNSIKKEIISEGAYLRISATFSVNRWGLNLKDPKVSRLEPLEVAELLAGGQEMKRQNDDNWRELKTLVDSATPKLLSSFTGSALNEYETPFRRAGAAKNNHHARRGGLLEHTLSMARVAVAMARCYPECCPGLLLCGVVFHDIGKIWENDYEPQGFRQAPTRHGVLTGHISTGMQIINERWRKLYGLEVYPALREHLVHLVLCHHGELAFGSPVQPCTAEGLIIHHIDMVDARVEMLRKSFANRMLVPGVHEAVKNFGSHNVVTPWNTTEESAALQWSEILEASFGGNKLTMAEFIVALETEGYLNDGQSPTRQQLSRILKERNLDLVPYSPL